MNIILRSIVAVLLLFVVGAEGRGEDGPAQTEDFPRFLVPGHEAEMARVQELFRLHHRGAFTSCTLWDAWLPHATLWPAVGAKPEAEPARSRYRNVFLTRRIDREGYVSMQQHRGLAHSEGWPFPTFKQSGGIGWYFSIANEAYGVGLYDFKPLRTTEGWEIEGASVEGFSDRRGLNLKATGDMVTVTTPPFEVSTRVAPFIRLEWAARALGKESRPSVSWLLNEESEWKPDRRAEFPRLDDADGLTYANVPVYRDPGYQGALKRIRFTFDHANGSTITLKSLITAIDTRHPITNINYVRGSVEYVSWTTDLPFLRSIIGRLRESLRYALKEFDVDARHLVSVPWVGHEGRTGLKARPNGRKRLLPGEGVGNNYWDLLPFGGDDGLATIYLYDALRGFAKLERAIAAHPEWKIPDTPAPFAACDLDRLADQVKAKFNETFWSEQTGRFVGWRDRDGVRPDYGFVFVNTEAIAYGIADDDKAKIVYDWLDGRRIVEGDTSQGADIYHWRFGPRSTTKRNVETYVWSWSDPGSIPWGNQVQDGGGVLGFSYFDLMARLRVHGPDDAWRRLQAILTWFGEVQSEGGYRAYYAKPGRGTLQGGGPPGGLGFDHEFMESVLVPQVMLYGFLGASPEPGGLRLAPRLPSGWPSLTVTRIHAQGCVLDVTARPDAIEIKAEAADGADFSLWLPEGRWKVSRTTDGNEEVIQESTSAQPIITRFEPGRTYRFLRLK